uniref:histidine kinase n=1 Tax=Desulfovibrio sp. U5L TaxID=596152 RepID=I2Q6N8_9BACT
MAKRTKSIASSGAGMTEKRHGESSSAPRPPATDPPQPQPLPTAPGHTLPIVAIGASAGGLEAIRTFFQHMPADSGAAFVIIQHLAPEFKSMMAEILQQSTTMATRQAEDGLRVESDNIYTNVPGKDLVFEHGLLRLKDPDKPRGQRLPIDRFFRSLAEDRQGNILCILMSGTGSDGTLSLKDVKGHGGITIAQEGDARYQDMPQSAINTGMVDYVLPAEAMPAKIMELIRNWPSLARETEDAPRERKRNAALATILRQLRGKTGHDFSSYKQNTIIRRIERRMALLQIQEPQEYEKYMRQNEGELKILFKELLIGVTGFFRDPESFEAVDKTVMPLLFAEKSTDDPVRLWIAGCSTGEEAYSIAIVLHEYMARFSKTNKVVIFATDIDEESLEFARNGQYPQAVETAMAPERLERYFRKEGGGYKVVKGIREMIVFASHSLIKDPPYSHMDLISCRNLLIYLEADLQKKVLPLLHYALNPGGFLFLGPSESVTDFSNLFVPVDRKWKLFQRKGTAPGRLVDIPMPQMAESPLARDGLKFEGQEPFTRQAEQIILTEFAPAGVVVSDKYEPLQFFGPVDRYFQVRAGDSTRNVLLLARDDLRLHLRAAIRKAAKEEHRIRQAGLSLRIEGKVRKFHLVVTPLKEDAKFGRLFLVVFEPAAGDEIQAAEPNLSPDGTALAASLEEELKTTKAELQATVEELESSNEELKSSNEELMSMNEELQSSNEELETSREELHSINEELTTVNTEMQHKVDELGEANSDLQNLMNSTRVATLFLDRNLIIRRFTRQVPEYFNILDMDIGRPFGHLRPKVEYEDVLRDIQRVLSDLVPVERQIRSADGRWIMSQIMPYRSTHDRIEGVVLTMIDITQLKLAEQRLTERTAEMESLYRVIPDIYLRIGSDGRIIACRSWGEPGIIPNPQALLGTRLHDLFPEKDGQDLENAVKDTRSTGTEQIMNLTVEVGGSPRHLEARIFPSETEVFLVLRDNTELKVAEDRLRFQSDALTQVNDGLVAVDNTDTVILWNAGAENILGIKAGLAIGRKFAALAGSQWFQTDEAAAGQETRKAGRSHWARELEHIRPDGTKIRVESSTTIIRNKQNEKIGLLSVLRDVSERKRSEDELLEAKRTAEDASQAKSEFLANMSHEIRTPLSGIIGMTDLLLGADPNERQRLYLESIQESADSLMAIINDILDFSKIEARKLELQEQPFDLAQIMDATLKGFKPLAEKKGLALTTFVHSGVPTDLFGDPVRLKQILVNLVGNAIKFTSKGGVDIQVGTLNLPDEMNIFPKRPTNGPPPDDASRVSRVRLLFSVRDTGIGIPLKNQQSIFGMFSQGDVGTKKQYAGTGLGLSITKSLITMMDGNIWVVSQEGKGSTFYCSVLLKIQNQHGSKTTTEEAAPAPGRPLKILLAEDNPINRLFLQELLRNDGHTIKPAVDGQEALEALQNEAFDLVLMDISMPGMDGIEATRRIRGSVSDKIDAKIPIIALTAHAFREDEERFLKAGMDGYLSKPIDPAKLRKILNKYAKSKP